MQIKEQRTIERNCCHPDKDLKRLEQPLGHGAPPIWFCPHCGRHWRQLSLADKDMKALSVVDGLGGENGTSLYVSAACIGITVTSRSCTQTKASTKQTS